uniref:Sugar phosphate phosphatase n=1 Tax=Suricata suricatta TaxID=37032 RepID=A0A673UGG3_SURSU
MAGAPASLSGRDVGSFAYLTIKDRIPQILTKAIDTLHRHKNEFFEKHGEKAGNPKLNWYLKNCDTFYILFATSMIN